MPDAVVDTTVLYAAGNERSQRHDRCLATLQAADHERLPKQIGRASCRERV